MNEHAIEFPEEAVSPSSNAPQNSLSVAGVALAAGVIGAGILAGSSPAQAITPALRFSDVPGTGDVKVLNYALALEDLETELYAQAAQRLTRGGRGGRDAVAGTNITGLNLANSERDVFFVLQYTRVERQHRDFLRGALGSAAIRPFKYDFNMESLSRRQVIELIYTAERTGVAAYLGAIPFFTGQNKNLIRIAASIQGTEARHTAIFADILNDQFGNATPVAPLFNQNDGRDTPTPPDAVLASVSPFIVAP
jgi:hypothetical protein